jgi:uncharacterized protein YyaL (SSP411 family)
MLADLRRRFIPNKLLALRPADGKPAAPSPHLKDLFAGKTSQDAEPTLYICQNFACHAPVQGKQAILAAWDELSKA